MAQQRLIEETLPRLGAERSLAQVAGELLVVQQAKAIANTHQTPEP